MLYLDYYNCNTCVCVYIYTYMYVCMCVCSPQTEVHAFPRSELHVSLSRTVPVPFHWIEPLSGALRESMAKYRPFTVDFSLLAYYSNDERTR